MATTFIETNKKPLKKVKVDPITLDLIGSAMRNARLEMDATLFRTALSPGIREQGDAFPMIANRCLLYTSPSPRDLSTSRMPSSA